MQQSHHTINELFYSPYRQSEIILTPPKLDKHTFGDHRAKFHFDGDIPEFLFIPSLDQCEEDVSPSHTYLEPRSKFKPAVPFDTGDMGKKKLELSLQPSMHNSKVIQNVDLENRKKKSTVNNSSSPVQIRARSA